MFNLDIPTEPYWLDLPMGVRVKVRPLDGMLAAAARSYAARRIAEMAKERAERIEAGAPVDDLPDTSDAAVRHGLMQIELAGSLARYGALAWEGVGDQADAALPFDAAGAERLARHPLMSDPFINGYFAPLNRVAAEGNASAPGPNGRMAPGANIALDASSPATTAPAPSTRRSRSKAVRSGRQHKPA